MTLQASMAARLRVEGTFRLRSRTMFVVHGRILAGFLRVGQRITSLPGLDAPVAAVEYVRTATGRRENPAACFEYRDDDQLAAWEALDLVGQTIELETGTIDRQPSP
jgi:hypothetical protein